MRAAAVAAVLGGVLLSGCSASPGTAAVVDGRTISQKQLETALDEVSPLLNGAESRSVLTAMIIAPFFIDAAEENEVGVSVTQTRELMDDAADTAGLAATDWSPESVEVVRFTIAASNLQNLPDGGELIADVEETVYAADLQVNPRYGTLQRESGRIVADTPTWIVAAPPDAAEGALTDE